MHQNKIILKTSKAHVRSMCNQTQDQFPKKHLSVHRHHKIYIVQSYVEIFRPKNEKKQNKTRKKEAHRCQGERQIHLTVKIINIRIPFHISQTNPQTF